MFEISKSFYESPIGIIKITGSPLGIQSLEFVEHKEEVVGEIASPVNTCHEEIKKYFSGDLKEFKVPLDFQGTDFQKKVWHELRHISYGETSTYLKLSKSLGDAKAIRAVGTANGKNPIAIIVPCHRVIGSDGSLTGYAGGLWRKEWLLNHEAEIVGKERQLEMF